MKPPRASPSLVVQVVDDLYAIACAEVVTVVPLPTLSAVPGSPRALLGTFSHRGDVVPVIDLARAFEAGSVGNRLAARVVLTRTSHGLVGVAVSRIIDVRRIDGESRALDVARHPAVGSAIVLDGRPIHRLELENALPPELRGLVAAP